MCLCEIYGDVLANRARGILISSDTSYAHTSSVLWIRLKQLFLRMQVVQANIRKQDELLVLRPIGWPWKGTVNMD